MINALPRSCRRVSSRAKPVRPHTLFLSIFRHRQPASLRLTMAYSANYLGPAKAPEGLRPFWTIRHGDTGGGQEVIVGGVRMWTAQGGGRNIRDLPLNELGKHQARVAGFALEHRRRGAAVISPTARTKETAEFGRRRGTSPIFDDGIAERNFYDLEGTPLPAEAYQGPWPGTEHPP